jgi:hypothetical protein
MSNHEMPSTDSSCNSDSCADAKALIAIIAVVVTTVCFWLLGQ